MASLRQVAQSLLWPPAQQAAVQLLHLVVQVLESPAALGQPANQKARTSNLSSCSVLEREATQGGHCFWLRRLEVKPLQSMLTLCTLTCRRLGDKPNRCATLEVASSLIQRTQFPSFALEVLCPQAAPFRFTLLDESRSGDPTWSRIGVETKMIKEMRRKHSELKKSIQPYPTDGFML